MAFGDNRYKGADFSGFNKAADPMAGMSDADLMALLGGGGDAPAEPYGSPISFGGSLWSYNQQTGKLEKLVDGGGGAGAGAAPPRPESMIDPRTGELVMIDAGGGVTRTGQVIGYGDIDPREKFAAEENQRGFQNATATYNSQLAGRQQEISLRQQAIDQFESAQNRLISVAGQKEQGRQADLRAAVDQWQTAMNLIPQMGQLAIQENERVSKILSEGNDFLSRAFESRGGTSPLAKVTQADQINNIGSQMASMRQQIADQMAGAPGSRGGYQAPELEQSGGGFGGPADMPAAPTAPTYSPYQLPAAPAVAPPSASPAASGGGGGFAAPAPAPAYNPAMDRDSWEGDDPASRAGATGLNSRDNPNIFPGIAQPAAPAVGPTPGGFDWGSYDEPNPEAAERIGGGNTTYTGLGGNVELNPAAGPAPGPSAFDRLGRWLTTPTPAYKDGTPSRGFTTAPVFVGNEEGPELFENPTGAPIRIHDAEATERMVPGFDEGTGSYGYQPPAVNRAFDQFYDDAMGDPSQFFGAGPVKAAGGGFRGLMSMMGRGKPAAQTAGPMVRDVGVGAYSPRRVGSGFVDVADRAYGSVPRYATGTVAGGFSSMSTADPNPRGSSLFNLPGGGTTDSALRGPQSGQSYGNYYQQFGGRDQFGHTMDNPNDVAINEARGFGRNYKGPSTGVQGYQGITQKSLIDLARSTAPPAVTAVLAGKMPPPTQALKAQDDSGETLPGITARQLQSMTPEEIKALGTTTNTIFNAPLEYVLGQTQRNYGAKEGLQRGFLRGAGL